MDTVERTDANLRETARLIASDKVEGTPVRRQQRRPDRRVERVMIDKRSGKVAYAVMTFGGFLGIGEEYRRAAMERVAVQRGPRRLRAQSHGRAAARRLRRQPAGGTPAPSAASGSATSTTTTGSTRTG